MTPEEILEYNKRCAEFLGYKECLVNITDNYGYKVVVEGYITPFPKLNFDGTIYQYDVDSLLFHSDWNWIMEVVEAIEKTVYNIRKSDGSEDKYHVWVRKNHCEIWPVWINKEPLKVNAKSKKEAVVQAINQFLIWYDTRIS